MKVIETLKICLVLLATVGLKNNQANAQNSKIVNVKNFNGVTVSNGIDLYLSQGELESLNIKGVNDLIKNITVEQTGTNLIIKYKEGLSWSGWYKNQSVKVYLSYKNLIDIKASGGSDVYTQNILKTELLNLQASGGSDLKLNLICKDLILNISGGADANLEGSGDNMKINASGGSDVNAFGYKVDFAKVTSSGGSDVNIFANKALEAAASGGSDINYKGNAAIRNTHSSKSGDINKVK